MTAHEEAVWYMLTQVKRDPDLMWLLAHTEAWALLCKAEAGRTGRPVDEVRDWSLTDDRPEYAKKAGCGSRRRGTPGASA
jgi:hypothetical protein